MRQTQPTTMPHAKPTILLIDDSPDNLQILGDILSEAGYEVMFAESGLSGLERTRFMKPDLILMDIGISGNKDGIETAELINKDYNIPIIFMTGNSDVSTTKRAKKINPIDILIKPISENQLKTKLLSLKTVD